MADTPSPDAYNPADKPRAGNGKFLPSIENLERDTEACKLRTAGWSYPEIAAHLGYHDGSGAFKAVNRMIHRMAQEPTAELVKLEVERLDVLWRDAMEVMRNKHLIVQNGKVVLGTNGEPMEDDAPRLAAINHLLAIQARRAKLLGLDAPKKVEVLTMEAIKAEIDRMETAMGIADQEDDEE